MNNSLWPPNAAASRAFKHNTTRARTAQRTDLITKDLDLILRQRPPISKSLDLFVELIDVWSRHFVVCLSCVSSLPSLFCWLLFAVASFAVEKKRAFDLIFWSKKRALLSSDGHNHKPPKLAQPCLPHHHPTKPKSSSHPPHQPSAKSYPNPSSNPVNLH